MASACWRTKAASPADGSSLREDPLCIGGQVLSVEDRRGRPFRGVALGLGVLKPMHAPGARRSRPRSAEQIGAGHLGCFSAQTSAPAAGVDQLGVDPHPISRWLEPTSST